jgi:hypothetical protein
VPPSIVMVGQVAEAVTARAMIVLVPAGLPPSVTALPVLPSSTHAASTRLAGAALQVIVVDAVVSASGHAPASCAASSTVTEMVAVPAAVHRKLIASDGPAASSDVWPKTPMGVPPLPACAQV